eukprot:tig00020927_g15937.t1
MGKKESLAERLAALVEEAAKAPAKTQEAFNKALAEAFHAVLEKEGSEDGGEGSSAGGEVDEKDYFAMVDEKKEDVLQAIRQEIRREMPTADAPDEETTIPEGGDFKDWTKENTQNVDAFLYNNDEELDDAIDEGVLHRFYCTACGSRQIKPLNFVSHSASLDQVRFIFGPKVLGELKGKVVADVGSRIGAVTFSAAVLSDAKEAVGIERNAAFAALQATIAKKFRLEKRVKVVAGDAKEGEGARALQRADVVVLNNVFQFFSKGVDALWKEWQAVRENCKKPGQRLVTVPSLRASVAAARPAWSPAEVEAWLSGWVKEETIEYPPRPPCEEEEGGCGEGAACCAGGGCEEREAKRARKEKGGCGGGGAECSGEGGGCGRGGASEMDEQDEFRRIHLYTVL